MKFTILGDFDSISGVEEVLSRLTDTKYRDYFYKHDYGDSIKTIVIVLLCHDYDFLKSKLRYSRKDLAIYMTILLKFDLFITLHAEERTEFVVKKILSELPSAILKYKLHNFDIKRFTSDLDVWMNKAIV